MHTHDFDELFWVEAGRGWEWVPGGRRRLEPGLLVLVRAQDHHAFSGDDDGTAVEFVNVAFGRGVWRGLVRRHPGLRGRWFDAHGREERTVRLDADGLARLRELAAELRSGARDGLAVEAFVAGMVAMLGARAERHAREENDPLPGWLRRAVEGIRDPRRFSGGTRELATLAGRSPEHVARELRRRTGRTPTQVVNEVRLAWAAGQLLTTDRPIVDLCGACGFDNLGHFYALFRQRFGKSPGRYRRGAMASRQLVPL